MAVHRTCNAKVPSSILGRGLVEQRQRRTNVQVPERSKGLVLGTSVFALAGSNPVLYTNAVPTFSPFFFSYTPTHLPRLRAVVPRSTRGGSSATRRRRQKTNERHAAEVTFDGSGRGLQTRGRLIPQEFDSPSTACSPPTRGLRAACVDGDSDGQCAREV